MQHNHPNKLLEQHEGLILFNLLEQASYILTDEVQHILVPPPRGLYVKGHITPILNDSGVYYPRSKIGNPDARILDFDEMFKLREDIVDENNTVIINSQNLIGRPHLFTTKPELPISAALVCYNVLVEYLFKYCKHARGVKSSHISNFIKPEYQEEFNEDYFENPLENALDELYEFIRRYDWNIYFHRLNGTTLVIERYCDFRVYEYTRMMYEKQQEQQGEDFP